LLRCRSVRVEIKGSCVRVLVNRGCPHGGLLSPLLWNMVVDGLLRRLHNAHYQVQGYAALRIFLRIINDFVHRIILDCTFVDLTVSLLILSFLYC
jgi:hypothetical protein